jgi:metal-sulfur cluster biosynthetic enzyme
MRMTVLEEKVRERVNAIIDPETGLTFGEMKLIRDLREKESGVIEIYFRPTSPFCPIAFKFAADIKNAALGVRGVIKVLVYCQDHVMGETINRILNEVNEPSQKGEVHKRS